MSNHAIICGAGIGGLSSALALLQRGWSVSVLEKSSVLSEVGAGIQISPNGCKVLAALGVLESVKQLAFEPEKIEMRVGQSGREVFSIPLKEYAEQRWKAPYLHTHRADLLSVLISAVTQHSPGAIKTNMAVIGYENRDGHIAALLDNGSELEANLLIGADGIHSAIRTQMHGEQQPRFTGNVAWRATVPVNQLNELAPDPTACVWVGKGRHAVTYRLRGGELANIVAVVERNDWQSESWMECGSREEALADFSGWHPTVRTMLEKAETHYRWALFDREPLTHWHDGRAVLLGDSCHAMLPFLAQGGTMALEDSLALSTAIESNKYKNLEDKLKNYFNLRITRTSHIQSGARKNMKVFHKPGFAYAPVQLATRAKPDLMHNRMDWIYDYEVPTN